MYWESKRRADDPSVFDFHIGKYACVGLPERQYLMGGCGLGAGIYAMEQAVGSPVLWASVQFVGTSLIGNDCTIKTEILHNGRRSAHARATIFENDRPVHIISGSHARISRPETETYLTMPDVAKPEDCGPRQVTDHPLPNVDNLMSKIEIRQAERYDDKGLGYLWLRATDGLTMSAPLLAIFADYMPAAHPSSDHCTSLDNVLRIHKLVESEWVLAECQVSEHRNGHFHGSVNMFAEDGTLLATGNQTGLQYGT